MPNIFETAAALGLEAAAAVNGTSVVYFRGDTEAEIEDSIKAGKPFKVITEQGMALIHRPDDWLVRRAVLVEAGLFPPEPGDFIRETRETETRIYRVGEADDEKSWREHVGTAGVWIRVHSELSSEF